jgi:hydroxymethylbilane synthase
VRLRIGARRSALARIQAQQVADTLRDRYPEVTVAFHFRESMGDRDLTQPLWQMASKGVFTEDLRGDLIDGRCDLVVHSWKDLPIETGEGTAVVATLPRADARDLLLVREDRWAAVAASRRIALLTSSPRRMENLARFLPLALPGEIEAVEFRPVRGNMQTRIAKMWQEGVDGLVLAKAALDRLLTASGEEYAETRQSLRAALAQCRWMVLPLVENPTAPAQGALAIEIASSREDLRAMLEKIHCSSTFALVEREREILKGHGGGCHQAIGAHVLERSYGRMTIVRGRDDAGQLLSTFEYEPQRPWPSPVERSRLWPPTAGPNAWFDRVEREELPALPTDEAGLWIARADALPAQWTVPASRIVWTAGLQTWFRLARRGVWVHGSAEGLGEQEDPGIGILLDRTPTSLRWWKLTHEGAPQERDLSSPMTVLQTYRLVPRSSPPDLTPYDYFYWTSGSSFYRALECYAWLRDKVHFCGPGKTGESLRAAGIDPYIAPDHTYWLATMGRTGWEDEGSASDPNWQEADPT